VPPNCGFKMTLVCLLMSKNVVATFSAKAAHVQAEQIHVYIYRDAKVRSLGAAHSFQGVLDFFYAM
jgi:hypothetical protein